MSYSWVLTSLDQYLWRFFSHCTHAITLGFWGSVSFPFAVLMGVISYQRKLCLEEEFLISHIQKTTPSKFNLVSKRVGTLLVTMGRVHCTHLFQWMHWMSKVETTQHMSNFQLWMCLGLTRDVAKLPQLGQLWCWHTGLSTVSLSDFCEFVCAKALKA